MTQELHNGFDIDESRTDIEEARLNDMDEFEPSEEKGGDIQCDIAESKRHGMSW